MNLINKLGKSLLAALLLTGAATIVSCGSDDSDDGPKLGELKAIFSSDNFSVEAGGNRFAALYRDRGRGRHARPECFGFQYGCHDKRHQRRQLLGVSRIHCPCDHRR